MKVEITTLIENYIDNEEQLMNEHGLSLYIEVDGKKILFDTGQSGDFIQNAEKLKKDLTSLDCIVISHGHYDHSGGLLKLIDTIGTVPKLLVGNEFFNPKYKQSSNNEYKYIGNAFSEEELQEKEIPMRRIAEDITSISDKILVFHNFDRDTAFEELNSKFYIKQGDSYLQDKFQDEIALGILTEKGLIAVVGCSHVGIVNILSTMTKRTNLPIYGVIGGTHLVDANEDRMNQTITSFKNMGLDFIAVSHCTGEEGIKLMKESFREKFIFNNTGNIIKIDTKAWKKA
jgi:7,8-dihydropterin-6-yl-methyl-4-(beta-D-ribofuranosyl)aminobenzene 5'-phosphate synthase